MRIAWVGESVGERQGWLMGRHVRTRLWAWPWVGIFSRASVTLVPGVERDPRFVHRGKVKEGS